jgi:chemotaxis signal transduction protein
MPEEVVKEAVNDAMAQQQSDEAAVEASEEGLVAEREEQLPAQQYCIFRAGRERFCLGVLDVEEVVDWPGVTRVPLGPPFLMGIFNLRGSIVPVIDIAFSEGRRPDLVPKRVVVAITAGEEAGDLMRVGIAADEVIGTYTTTEPLLVDEKPKDVPHCRGMLRHNDRLALAIDVKRLIRVFPIPVV